MPRFISGALRVIVCLLLGLVMSLPARAIAQEPDSPIASSTLSDVQRGPTPDEPIAETWRFDGSGYTSLRPPLVTDDLAITVGDNDEQRTIIALDKRTGKLVWQRTMSGETLDSIAIAGDLVFHRGDEGFLQARSVDDGDEAWTSDVTIGESPQDIVTDGDHVVVTDGDRTVAVEVGSGDMLWEARPFPGGEVSIAALASGTLFAVSGSAGEGVIAVDVATGAELWRHARPGGSLAAQGTANDAVFVTRYDDEPRGQGWIALDARSGAPLWESPMDDSASIAVASADTLYACGDDGVVALDVLTGSSVWSKPGACSGITVTDNAVNVTFDGANGQGISSLSLAGEPRWSFDIDGAFDEISGHAVNDETIYVGTTSRNDQAELIALSGAPANEASTDQTGETVQILECSDFSGYDEVQAYYAEHPEAQPVLDTNMNGLACEVYFAEDPAAPEPVAPSAPEPPVVELPGADPAVPEPPVAESPPDDSDTGSGTGGDAPAPPDGGGAGNPGGGGAPIYTDFGGLDGVDYDCYDFASPDEAQAYFESDGGSSFNNADGLDRNHNGLACEPGEFD